MFRLKAILAAAILGVGVSVSSYAFADSNIEAVPTNWRLQDYGDGAVNIYFTGAAAPCNSGQLTLPASAPEDTKNRLWTLVITAKATGKVVGLFYDPNACTITSFYLKEG